MSEEYLRSLIEVKLVDYNIDDIRKLKRKRRTFREIIEGWFINSHVCQVCKRKEGQTASGGWLQIDHPKHKDKDGCSVVCLDCARANPNVFGKV